uniref:Solute carrier family 35 member F2-like n=1 Tax=Phallusia mammillata TaxID=59560 RepID=A0A6F9DS20_9ASCI|nr:solute carrier family 35 member F2-like [Phallusia mammillata]
MEEITTNETDVIQTSSSATSTTLSQTFIKVKRGLKHVFTWGVLKPVLYGQGLSLLICGTAVSSEYLYRHNVSLPVFQGFLNYVLLCLVYTTMLICKRTEDGKILLFHVLKENWWKYIILAIFDVEANYMVVLAYQYTSLTSVQLLDCFILPVVMVLSYLLLKIRYLPVHYVGVFIALVGVACMVGADVIVGKSSESGSNPALGDVLVLAGAVCYGISNVSMEFIAKRHSAGNVEFLGMYGLFCPIISGIQMAILERQTLAALQWNSTIILLLAAFAVCMFLLYSLMPVVMKLSSATAVNISLLTADLYALFAGLFLFQDKMSALYVVSFITIVCALVIYNSKPPVPRMTEPPIANSHSGSLNSIPNSQSNEDQPLTETKGTCFKSNCVFVN